jgi:CheY-like chemotaxis protein
LALAETDQPERDAAIKGALGATAKGATLVHQLLAFARKARLENRTIPVQQALSDLQEMARRVVPSRIRIEFGEVEPDLAVLADPALLATALLNLILNSRDAISGSGIVQIDVCQSTADRLPSGLVSDKKPNSFVLFTVRDNGKGIAPDMLAKATEPFFTTKPVGFGSGLGLSMVQGFAQQSGGGILITSELGVGTTVFLALPVGDPSPEPVRVPVSTENTNALSGQVLIVEDQPELLQIIARLTGSLGLAPFKASTADEACGLIDSGLRPELLITDAVMPGNLQMVDLLLSVKKISPRTKIIVISGYDELQIDRVAHDLPNFTFIQKPFTISGLVRSIRELMHEPKA